MLTREKRLAVPFVVLLLTAAAVAPVLVAEEYVFAVPVHYYYESATPLSHVDPFPVLDPFFETFNVTPNYLLNPVAFGTDRVLFHSVIEIINLTGEDIEIELMRSVPTLENMATSASDWSRVTLYGYQYALLRSSDIMYGNDPFLSGTENEVDKRRAVVLIRSPSPLIRVVASYYAQSTMAKVLADIVHHEERYEHDKFWDWLSEQVQASPATLGGLGLSLDVVYIDPVEVPDD